MITFTSWNDELKHYGILGMRWGVRKYQNEDGTLTAAGKERYDKTGTADSIFLRTSSRTTRGLKRRLAKDEKRSAAGKEKKFDTEKLKSSLKKSEAFDRKVQKRVAAQSGAKTFAQAFLMGSRGALRYNQMRTAGAGRLVSYGASLASSFIRNFGLDAFADIGYSVYQSSKHKQG